MSPYRGSASEMRATARVLELAREIDSDRNRRLPRWARIDNKLRGIQSLMLENNMALNHASRSALVQYLYQVSAKAPVPQAAHTTMLDMASGAVLSPFLSHLLSGAAPFVVAVSAVPAVVGVALQVGVRSRAQVWQSVRDRCVMILERLDADAHAEAVRQGAPVETQEPELLLGAMGVAREKLLEEAQEASKIKTRITVIGAPTQPLPEEEEASDEPPRGATVAVDE